MKFNTRTGDHGETGLIGGVRVPKNDAAVSVCGDLDETNSCIGLALSMGLPDQISDILVRIQCDLFVIGSRVAESRAESKKSPALDQDRVRWIEESIDRLDAQLPPLEAFVLPGGIGPAAQLHFTRSVCRRAERGLVELADIQQSGELIEAMVYLNRLSDLLFVLARFVNHCNGVAETKWIP